MFSTNKARNITIGSQSIQVFDPPKISGPTDGIQFAGHMARVSGNAVFGETCRCGKDRLVNVIAEDEPDKAGCKRIVIKCYACGDTFASKYPE